MLMLLMVDIVKPDGMSNEEFIKIWNDEAVAASAAIKEGDVIKHLWKAAGQYQVIGVFDLPDGDAMDAALHGLPGSDPADALHPVVTIPQLIKSIGKNSAALELLAGRQHELTPTQRRAALERFAATAPKARKPNAARPASRRLAGLPLRGFHR